MKSKKIMERQYKNSKETNDIKKIIKITIAVLLFFIIVYLIAGLLTGEIKFKKEFNEEVKIQYSEILAESTFKQKKNEYYVLYYDFDDNKAMLIEAIASDLSSDATVYNVDLSKGFNKNYIAGDEKVKNNPRNINELKVTNPTLIKIKNNKVIKFQKGINQIKEYAMKLK